MEVLIVLSGFNIKKELVLDYVNKSDYIICADGGAKYFNEIQKLPNLLIGDFDSIDSKQFTHLKANNVEIITYPQDKDFTDSEIAIRHAIKLNPKHINIIGGTGGRFDHHIVNVHLLKLIDDNNIFGKLIDDNNEIYLIQNEINLEKGSFNKISLIPISDKVTGVKTQGLLYPLNNKTLYFGESIGVSNEFTENTIKVNIDKGILLIVKSKD